LFGGGFALADSFIDSGLTKLLAERMISLKQIPGFLMILIISAVVCAVTDVASNVASAQIFLPILAALSEAVQIHPLLLMIPATISCSFSFLLPISTAPNMVVFSTKRLTIIDMVLLGIVLDVVGTLLVTTVCYFLLPLIFKIH
jgi:sodium-dependent dicarboxylate transporter 2/3/5